MYYESALRMKVYIPLNEVELLKQLTYIAKMYNRIKNITKLSFLF